MNKVRKTLNSICNEERKLKITPSHLAVVKSVARDKGLNLSPEEMAKHAQNILRQWGDSPPDDTYGQHFYDACKEYFLN